MGKYKEKAINEANKAEPREDEGSVNADFIEEILENHKKELKNLREMEETVENNEVDYNSELKSYKQRVAFGADLNRGVLYLIKEYINCLYNNTVESENFVVNNIYFVNNFKDFNYANTIVDEFLNTGFLVDVKYKGELDLIFNIHCYINSEGRERICMALSSKHDTYYAGNKIYKKLLDEAIRNSGLKGSCFAFYGELNQGWYFPKISKRDLSDIYIPDDLMDDVKFYEDHFDAEGGINEIFTFRTPRDRENGSQ